MKGSVIRNIGKAHKSRTPALASMNKQRKAIEEAADLGTLHAIVCMIITCTEKAAGLRCQVMAQARLNAIATEARSISDEIRIEFEKFTA